MTRRSDWSSDGDEDIASDREGFTVAVTGWRWCRAAGLACAVLLLAACGAGAGRGTAETASTSATTPSSTDSTATATTTSPPVSPAVTPRGTTVDATLTVADGTVRSYRLYVPSTLRQDEAVPLLLALHGGTGWGAQFQSNSGFDGLAEANGFIVAYPDGTPIGVGRGRVWNGGACCGSAQEDRDDVDDVGFLSELIAAIAAEHPIDPAGVYATGHSNGAIMAYRLACELSETVVAVGFQAGSLEVDDCDPALPVSVYHLHGAEDANLPIDGGRGEGISNTDFTSPRRSIAVFAELNACPDPADSVDPVNPDVSHRVWAPCEGGTTVEFVTVAGANHGWMGHPGPLFRQVAPYPDYDASLAIWTFLAAQRRG